MPYDITYEVTELDNGLRVAHRKVDVPDISFRMTVREGSMHEPDETRGALHFIEHLFYRSSTGKNVKQDFFDITGRDAPDAYTTPESMVFAFRMPAGNFPEFLELWGACVLNTEYEENGFAAEKATILNEIAPAEQEGTLSNYVRNLYQERIFPGCVLGIAAGGTTDTVRRLSRHDIGQQKKQRLNAHNVYLAVAGGYEAGLLKGQLEEHFGKLPDGLEKPWQLEGIAPVRPVEDRRVFPGTSYPTLTVTMQAPGEAYADILPACVLQEYFGGGASSRLFQAIREEKGLAYVARIQDSPSSLNRNLWHIAIERFDEADYGRIKKTIEDEMEKVRQGDIDMRLLETLKRSRVKTFYQNRLEQLESQAHVIDVQAQGKLPYSLREVADFWEAVTPHDLARSAQEIFNGRYATVMILPK